MTRDMTSRRPFSRGLMQEGLNFNYIMFHGTMCIQSKNINPYLVFRDNSRAGGVCQLKSLSYLQYTTCNHSEQVFSYRSEPTFIQTRHFSLDSQVLDFTHTKKDPRIPNFKLPLISALTSTN